MPFFLIFILSFFLFSCSTEPTATSQPNTTSENSPTMSSKRIAPKEVQPITIKNVRYTVTMNKIIATDVLTKYVFWAKEIYPVSYDESLERDVQDIFIDSISIEGNLLKVRNEHEEYYILNLETMEVKRELK